MSMDRAELAAAIAGAEASLLADGTVEGIRLPQQLELMLRENLLNISHQKGTNHLISVRMEFCRYLNG